MAIHLAERPNGVNIYQVTTDKLEKSNIYCELPYCSADSSTFVYQQQNPDDEVNRTEYVACEFGTWKSEIFPDLFPENLNTKIFLLYVN